MYSQLTELAIKARQEGVSFVDYIRQHYSNTDLDEIQKTILTEIADKQQAIEKFRDKSQNDDSEP